MYRFLLLLCFLILGLQVHAQVGINTENPQAALDVRATANPEESGVMIPKLADFPSVTAAQDGMMIFIDGTGTLARGFYYYTDGSGWSSVGGTGGGTLDQAYDFGGLGIGNTINATDGTVTIAGVDGLTVTGTLNTGVDIGTPGAGVRMFFNPRRAAFRAGRVTANQWDQSNVGAGSVALGVNNTAIGASSIAMGTSNLAGSSTAISMGDGNIASGNLNIALGTSNLTDEEGSIAIGSNNQSDGEYSISIGDDNVASNELALAIGSSNTSSGRFSAAIGNNLTATSGYETVLGRYNTTYTPNSTSGFDADDRLLTVGNGTSNTNMNDALTIKKNGFTGINTSNPQGALHVETINNTGFVLPRVTSVDDVTDGQGNPPLEGTAVYDLSRQNTCFYNNGEWSCIGYDADTGETVLTTTNELDNVTTTYIKASNTDTNDEFGRVAILSGDGTTLVISAHFEDSDATGINGNQSSNLASFSGAIYVFVKQSGIWSFQAYIKASNAGSSDRFGRATAVSDNGNTIVVGALREQSVSTGINGIETDNTAGNSGAVYVFERTGAIWSQQAYIKSSNSEAGDSFGNSIDISGSGNTIVVGAPFEDSNATGINGNQNDNSSQNSGAVYIFERSGITWNQTSYLKSFNSEINDEFGRGVGISGDGNTILITASGEDSAATGINGNQADNTSTNSGAGYVFIRSGVNWTQEAYIKHPFSTAGNSLVGNIFSTQNISFSHDGNTLAIGSNQDTILASGINGTNSGTLVNSGSVIIFIRIAGVWSQQAYIKADFPDTTDYFGTSVSITSDGNLLIVSAYQEDANSQGISSSQNPDNSLDRSGAVFIYERSGSNWTLQSFIKPDVNDGGDFFGTSVSISSDGSSFCVGSAWEDGNGLLLTGDPTNNAVNNSGAVWLFEK